MSSVQDELAYEALPEETKQLVIRLIEGGYFKTVTPLSVYEDICLLQTKVNAIADKYVSLMGDDDLPF